MTYRFAISTVLLAALCSAQEWPQWRGPGRDGSIPDLSTPASWPEKLHRKWRVTIGEGHSSPVVSAGRIFTFARRGGREEVSCLDPGTGEIRWRESYAAGEYAMPSVARGHGEGPKSTPVVYRGRIYTLGIAGILSSFDAETGRMSWRKDFSGQVRRTHPLYGTAMSPLVDGGLLIAHVGGHDDGALTAFDATSGEEKWSWGGDGPGYASPIAVELDGVRQIVTQSQESVIGISAANGELLWRVPLRTPHSQNIITPVVHEGLLIVSGLSNPATAFRVTNQGGDWSVERVWENRLAEMYMSSPVIAGGLLFGFAKRSRGHFYCLDAATGEMEWSGEPRTGDYASILTGNGVLLMLTEHAELTVARATGEKFDVIRTYTVADTPTWAHLVPLGNGLLIKDKTSLAYWTW